MSGSRKGGGKGGARGGRQPARPAAKKPAAKAAPRTPSGQPVVGKRPSKPSFLAVIAILWFAAAVVALLGIHRGWRLIPVVCFAGVGLFYLRGAAASYLRRSRPEPSPKK